MHRLYPLNPYCFIGLERERKPHVIVRDDIHPWAVEAEVGIEHVNGRHAAAEADAIDL